MRRQRNDISGEMNGKKQRQQKQDRASSQVGMAVHVFCLYSHIRL